MHHIVTGREVIQKEKVVVVVVVVVVVALYTDFAKKMLILALE
jgi:hypothetical protein